MVEVDKQHSSKKSKIYSFSVLYFPMHPSLYKYARVIQPMNLLIHLHSPDGQKWRTGETLFFFELFLHNEKP